MLQIGAALFYYKLGQTLLQIGAASLLQIRASVVTNWGSYYKLGQLLLQNRAAITNWGKMYYKLGQVLQIRAIITNWRITTITHFFLYCPNYHCARKTFFQKVHEISENILEQSDPTIANILLFDDKKQNFAYV